MGVDFWHVTLRERSAPIETQYRVTATRSHGMWELEVHGVGVTQTRRAGGAEAMVRDYLVVLDAEEAETAPVEITWSLGEELDGRIRSARDTAAEAARLQTEGAAAAREVISLLKDEGLSGREIAIVLGLSEQRISQLSKN